MDIESIIHTFIEEMGYIQNEHVLGILFYGSYLTGFNEENSDIDLHIIFDGAEPNHSVRGNKVVNGVRIEYFEKTIEEVYETIDEDFQNQNNASLLIFGKSKIVYAKDDQIQKMQDYAIKRFSKKLPPLDEESVREQISIIDNRMQKLESYAENDDQFFEHLYHLTIEKIRRFYHESNGIPRIEAFKGFRLYTDSTYRNAFAFQNIPEPVFLSLYFEAITDTKSSKTEKYRLLETIYNISKKGITLGEDYRIHIKSRNENFEATFTEPTTIGTYSPIPVPHPTAEKVLKFIKEMDYLKDEHCLGLIVYGSSLTGFNKKGSDIDLHIIYDDEDSTKLIRGSKMIDGTKIEYFEKPIRDVYLGILNGYYNQDNALFSIIGNGTIIFERGERLLKLRQFARDTFASPMPPLDEESVREQVSILNNRMEKLEDLASDGDPKFDHMYHLAIDKMRKLYHRRLGLPRIPASKVYRIYTDSRYRKSMYKENPDEEFIRMYLTLITTPPIDKLESLSMLEEFYRYTTFNVDLGTEYRIDISKKRHIIQPKSPLQ